MVEVFICSVLHAIGQEDEAVGVVADLVARSREEHISGYVLASALLLTGDEPRALDHLEQANDIGVVEATQDGDLTADLG